MLTKIYHHLIRIIPKESAVKIKMGTNILVIRFRADEHVCRAISEYKDIVSLFSCHRTWRTSICCVQVFVSNMDERVARARSSSSASSLFFPTPKAPPQRGNFLMTYFSCPVGSLEQNSVNSSARPRGATLITENTYKMEPDKRFSVAEVRAILHQHLQSLETQKYDAKLCREVAKGMCNSIMSDLKLLGYSRFKFVCSVTIGQNKGQGVRIASRSVWDTNCDQFVSESFKNETLFAVGVVFGVYKE